MALYKLDKREGYHRTIDYRFTVWSKNDENLIALKKNVQRHNKIIRESFKARYKHHSLQVLFDRPWDSIKRVSLMARGPRTKPALDDYGYARAYDQNLPHEHATHFDVYVGTDTYAMDRLRFQLEHGLTPGQHAAIDKAKRMEWDAHNRSIAFLNSKGIRVIGTRNGTEYRTTNG